MNIIDTLYNQLLDNSTMKKPGKMYLVNIDKRKINFIGLNSMKKDYTKLYDSNLAIKGQCGAQGKSGAWHNARPEPYYGFIYRIRDAWNVLFSKADALYWTIDLDK